MPASHSRVPLRAPSASACFLSVRSPTPPVQLHHSASQSGLHPNRLTGAPVVRTSGAWLSHGARTIRSPLRLALHEWGGPPSPKPIATLAAADFSLRGGPVALSGVRRDLPR